MASIAEAERALINADAAGDVDAARMLAAEVRRLRTPVTDGTHDNLKGAVGSFASSALDGLPIIGPAINAGTDRIAAFGGSLANGTNYDDELSRIQNVQKAQIEANPTSAVAGTLTGGVLGTAPMVAAAPAAFGAAGGSMAARSLASLLTGGLLGGGDAAVRSGGDVPSVVTGTGIGAVAGAATPALASGFGKGVTYLADRIGGFSKATGPIAGLPRPAVSYALESMGDPTRQMVMRAELERLGPQAMLADVSPEWLGMARGAASRPGLRDEIVNPLLARDAAKNTRLAGDLDSSLGPTSMPSQVAGQIDAGQTALGPSYENAFRNARAVDTTSIAQALEAETVNLRGPAQRAAMEVRKMLNVVGERDVLDPNPYTLFQTRQAIDGLMAGEANPQVSRVLTNARRQIDDTLARAVPGLKDADAQFAELARQRGAFGRGQQALDSGRTAPRPQELADEMFRGANPQGNMVGPSAVPLRLRQGARAEVDRVVGTNANDPAALQRLMKSEGDWNRDRLRTLFGQQNADDALNAIDRETQFYRTSNRVTSGSDTAMANRFGDFLDNAAKPSAIPTDTTITGAALRGGQKFLQAAMGADAEAAAAQFAKDLGRLSVAQGAERDAIITSLLRAAQRRQSLAPLSEGAESLARLMLNGARPVANQRLLDV